jgi:hypothetical protein
MKYFYLIIALSYQTNLYCQNEYHESINLGNRSLYLCDYEKAEKYYLSADSVENFFFEDFKKLVFVTHKLDDKDKVFEYLKFLVGKRNFNPNMFAKEFPYLAIKGTEMKILTNLFLESKGNYTSSSISAIREIFKSDQEVRRYEDIKSAQSDIAKSIYKSRDSLDEINAERLLALLREHDWPNEATSGIFIYDDLPWTRVFYVLGIHFVRDQPELLKYFLSNVKKGNVHPSDYASIADFYYENTERKDSTLNYMNTTVDLVLGEPYSRLVDQQDSIMNYVNKNRAAIGLDSFHVTQKHVIASRYGLCNRFRDANISISSYPYIATVSAGFAKFAFSVEKEDMNKWKINLDNLKSPCACQKRK